MHSSNWLAYATIYKNYFSYSKNINHCKECMVTWERDLLRWCEEGEWVLSLLELFKLLILQVLDFLEPTDVGELGGVWNIKINFSSFKYSNDVISLTLERQLSIWQLQKYHLVQCLYRLRPLKFYDFSKFYINNVYIHL